MPDPADFDSEEDFMAACIPAVEAEGADHDQAVAQCLSMWSDREVPKVNTYERTCQIERVEGAEAGLISGTLVTDGEASDGHILNIKGGELPDRAPLLFGHDDITGTGNLGSWISFHKEVKSGGKLGDSRIRGNAQIELEGEGSQAEWRKDIDHMISKGHIGAFSVRWSEIGEPVPRVNLPSDHPAYVDSKKANGRQRWGLYFDKWKLLEGSVVTLGADPAALIGRLQEADGDLRTYWRKAINYALVETHQAADLVGVDVGDGQIVYVERAAWEAMLEEANRRCSIALDALEDANATYRLAQDIASQTSVDPEVFADAVVERIRSNGEISQEREDPEETQPEQEEPDSLPAPEQEDAASLSATPLKPPEIIDSLIQRLREAHAPRKSTRGDGVIYPRELFEILDQRLGEAWKRVNKTRSAEIKKAQGVIEDG